MAEDNTGTNTSTDTSTATVTDQQQAEIQAILDKGKPESPAGNAANNADEPQIPRSKMNALNEKLRIEVEKNASQEVRLRELEAAEKDRTEAASILAGKSSDVIDARDATIANLEGQLTEARLRETRFRIATSKNLPPELADLVTGNDAVEIAANADGVMAAVNKHTGGAGFVDGGRRPATGSILSVEEKRAHSKKHGNYDIA